MLRHYDIESENNGHTLYFLAQVTLTAGFLSSKDVGLPRSGQLEEWIATKLKKLQRNAHRATNTPLQR